MAADPGSSAAPGDSETAAIEAIAAALLPLDRPACARVLKWAEERYTRLTVLDGDLDAVTRFTESLVEAARTIGDVTPVEIVRFAANVQRYERERVAAAEASGGDSA